MTKSAMQPGFRGRAGLLWGSLVLAALSIVGLAAARWNVANATAAVATARQALSAAQSVEEQNRRTLALRRTYDELMSRSQRHAVLAKDWDERRINVRQAQMSRASVNRLLSEMSRSPDRLAGASFFEISVKDPQDGLFTRPASMDADLVVSLRGTVLFRAARRS